MENRAIGPIKLTFSGDKSNKLHGDTVLIAGPD
jgi:hypothetical protein